MTGDESASQTERNLLSYSLLHFVQMCVWSQPPASLRLQDRKPNKRQENGNSLKALLKQEALRDNQSQAGDKRGPLAPRLAQHWCQAPAMLRPAHAACQPSCPRDPSPGRVPDQIQDSTVLQESPTCAERGAQSI